MILRFGSSNMLVFFFLLFFVFFKSRSEKLKHNEVIEFEKPNKVTSTLNPHHHHLTPPHRSQSGSLKLWSLFWTTRSQMTHVEIWPVSPSCFALSQWWPSGWWSLPPTPHPLRRLGPGSLGLVRLSVLAAAQVLNLPVSSWNLTAGVVENVLWYFCIPQKCSSIEKFYMYQLRKKKVLI